MTDPLSLNALPGLPAVGPGDDLGALICGAADAAGLALRAGDVVAVAQKIVSKAENRLVALADVTPSARARELARAADKDPRLVELILSESQEVMRVTRGIIIVRHRLGLVLANAGIDQSNVPQHGDGVALLLPENPDRSCALLCESLHRHTGAAPATLMVDSIGRAWRRGTIGTAIGASGLPCLLDLRGRADLSDRPLQTTELGYADEIASAASLLMGQADEGRPVVVVRGLAPPGATGAAAELVRPREQDLFP